MGKARGVPAAVLATLASACVAQTEQAPARLSADAEQPALALFERVLSEHFAREGSSAPAVCAVLRPDPLSDAQQAALLARFARLAPAAQCRAGGGQVIEVYGLTCRTPLQCTGWATVPNRPATRYAMVFAAGAWRFAGDPRFLGE